MRNALVFIAFVVLFFGNISTCFAKEILVSGYVYFDKNENGIKEKSESGIKNIPVSNGKDIVLTDSKGGYTLSSSSDVSVFPIIPSGFQFSQKSIKVLNSNFKYVANHLNAGSLTLNFGFVKSNTLTNFRFAAVGDIQVGDAAELNYATKSIGAELASRTDCEFNLMLGDLVNDNPPLLPVMKELFTSFHSPTWTVYGNHDRIVNDSTTSDAAYNQSFGSSVYAFNKGQVHFIVLNNIFPKGRKGYEGKFSDDQMEFVKNDLKLVPKGHLIVISQHIPLQHTQNREQLLDLLNDRKQVLILSGHMHTTGRYFYKTDAGIIHELGAGASCGNWWTGEKNEYDVPTALMQCGSLPNYYVIDINKNNYSFNYKVIGQDTRIQMGIWINSLSKTGQNELVAGDSLEITANIFGGSDSTRVYMSLDNKERVEMKKAKMVSPNVEQLVNRNKENIYPTSGNSRNPLRKSPSPHIWIVSLPGFSSGIHQMEIEALDKFGLNVKQKQQFYIP